MLLELGSLLVEGFPSPCPPACQCYDTSKVFCSEERMREIPAGLPGNATQLFFMETALSSVRSGALGSSTTLTKLNLRLPGNKIETLPPGIFRPLRRLQTLDLSQNALAELPAGLLAPLTALLLLKLSENLLVRVAPGTFGALSHLEGNRLATLPATLLASTPHLLHLSLAHNLLETLPQGLFSNLVPAGLLAGLPLLTALALDHNRLARLPPRLFDASEELARVGLADNPWACDCHLAYLLGWLQGFAEPLTHAQASCASPAALRGRSLLEVPQRQLECPGEASIPPEEGWDGVLGEDAPGQCTYSNPEGTISMACDATSCQQLSLRLPPPPGPAVGPGPVYQGTWVLRSRCGTLQVSVLVTMQSGDEVASPGLPAVP
ncbi:PREDICTED: carboxypeptidase N subunit 2-like [Tauraco erythrolophus]|uniref:carboxypeptidase N subunit 2-like n=1 Tax=Tauraco erythrolophus TaxID=121530 RepID=UPI0005237787|nr:PREDICTED: carboxypeptidase N subunit 2-like [Tauraco erythrolophus]